MATYRWNGAAATGAFATAKNGQFSNASATTLPGPNDLAIVTNAAVPISGTGKVQVMNFSGTNKLLRHVSANYGAPVNEHLTLLPGAILNPASLQISLNFSVNPATTTSAKVSVGEKSQVVLSESNAPDSYGIQIANAAGSQGTLEVQGKQAVVSGNNAPMSVDQNGKGLLTITDGAFVSVGNGDPLIFPWGLMIGNHAGSNGTEKVVKAALRVHGQTIVGRKSSGTLDIGESGLVVTDDLAIGWVPTPGVGAVTVDGHDARLIVMKALEVQHMGQGSLKVSGHGLVSAGIGIIVNGAVTFADGIIETMALGVNSGATLSGSGTVIASAGFRIDGGTVTAQPQLKLIGGIDNAGTIVVAAHSALQCYGAISDTGAIKLGPASVTSLEAVESGQTITFGGNPARLVLHSPGAFEGVIDGFAHTNEIELDAHATTYQFTSPTLTLRDVNNQIVAQLQMLGTFGPNAFQLTPGNVSVIKLL
ncbi:MAG: hypothetical protein CPDRYMAC_6441 [uncultured Paraburkholderia sp.]|nr:MAG: hypothetical protein CPDRYDRY_6366 [uncultured Paraburkholderia sp.]CAH2944466.1 MAG: hypothetical protein CPDRYMAC_6441 [uncultured Paraburkholderia sp.]